MDLTFRKKTKKKMSGFLDTKAIEFKEKQNQLPYVTWSPFDRMASLKRFVNACSLRSSCSILV
jgi:hypothetical protein